MEILCVRIASEEFDENFIRLDDGLLSRDSAFIALARDIISFTTKLQSKQVCIDETKLDYKHLEVLMDQCKEQIQRLKKRSINLGISVGFTYELECLEQILARLEKVVYLVGVFGTKEFGVSFVDMFKEAVKSVADKNALFPVLRQSIRIISKSITNNIGEHGEHYIVDDLKGYVKMFLSSAGAGIVIAIMALIKINILKADLSFSLNSILISLNYGLGFVLIHFVGFTVATKQPAMTASTFASEVQKDESNKANQGTLIELIFKVSRSQFASVMGNVFLALLISFLISKFMIANDSGFLDEKKAFGYLDSLEPFLALGFAAIAGVWLFCSGLIAGYFDNRADVLQLKDRFYHHPLLKRFLKDKPRQRVANYLHHHHGSIAGNFFFGILLGITPVIGYMFGVNLDIAHVAFSSANLGYAATHIDIDILTFLYYLCCVFMIGFVNLIVSFMLALKVSLISRDTSIGNLFLFLKALFFQMLKRPLELVFKSNKKG